MKCKPAKSKRDRKPCDLEKDTQWRDIAVHLPDADLVVATAAVSYSICAIKEHKNSWNSDEGPAVEYS